MSLQFRKCSLSDGFDIYIVSVFDSQLAGLFCQLQMFTWELWVAFLILAKQISFE